MFIVLISLSCNNLAHRNYERSSANIKEIRIGNQVWMASNFDGVIFRNGDSVPHVKSNEEWEKAGKEGRPAWCYYGNDSATGEKYGRMYNWHAVNDPRGLIPKGWHMPTNKEWIVLENYLGIAEAGLRLKSNGTGRAIEGIGNSSNFSALMGGYRDRNGRFTGLEEFTYLSGITEDRESDIWGRGLHIDQPTVMRCLLDKKFGLYLRCVKD